MPLTDFTRACFVIMPFGEKKVGDVTVDFNRIYGEIFEPAIAAADMPEGGKLVPHRTDQDLFSSSINQDMYEYIKYSRMALADISGSNPNALYELGIRHTVQEAGTVIMRQEGHAIPFDIGTIKIFEYRHLDDSGIADSKALICRILTESLKRNRLDSPVRQALDRQLAQKPGSPDHDIPAPANQAPQARAPDLDLVARDAHSAFMARDWSTARIMNQVILRLDPMNQSARMELGLTNARDGRVLEAQNEFATLVRLYPDYAEAWREKAVAESLIMRRFPEADWAEWAAHSLASFARATSLNSTDADAFAAWGGVLRRLGDFAGAHAKYQHASDISNGHPYPFLNAVKMKALINKSQDLDLDPEMLANAMRFRQEQVDEMPAADVPWCFLDLAVCKLLMKDGDGWIDTLTAGLDHLTAYWQAETILSDLHETLVAACIDLPRLDEGLALLEKKEHDLKVLKDNVPKS